MVVFTKTLLIMLVLFAFMIPGYALKKLKLLGSNTSLVLSNILLYVCQPALFINAFCVFSQDDWQFFREIEPAKLVANFSIVIVISLFAFFAVFGLCKLVFIKSKDKDTANVYTFLAMFANSGFMGVPFVEMFTDGNSLAVMYLMVFNIVFNVLCWTLGVALISKERKNISFKRVILNPSIIATVVSLLLFFIPQINLFMIPQLQDLQLIPKYLSQMSAPLSMMIVGVRLADMSIGELFADKGNYLSATLRLIVAPLLTLAIGLVTYLVITSLGGTFASDEQYLILAPIIAMSMAPASIVVALSERFGGNTQKATSSFVFSSILSIIIVPLLMLLVTTVLGCVVN